MNICCPKCGKILGEQVQDHIEIDNSKTNIQIYGAAIVRRECSNPQLSLSLIWLI